MLLVVGLFKKKMLLSMVFFFNLVSIYKPGHFTECDCNKCIYTEVWVWGIFPGFSHQPVKREKLCGVSTRRSLSGTFWCGVGFSWRPRAFYVCDISSFYLFVYVQSFFSLLYILFSLHRAWGEGVGVFFNVLINRIVHAYHF